MQENRRIYYYEKMKSSNSQEFFLDFIFFYGSPVGTGTRFALNTIFFIHRENDPSCSYCLFLNMGLY